MVGGENATTLVPAKTRALVPNRRVVLRRATWREEMGLLLAWPLAFAAWAMLPLATWAMLATGAGLVVAPLLVLYRGRYKLRQLRQRLDRPEEVVDAFEALATGVLVSPGVRCDAAAHAALIRLENGDLDDAVRLLALPLRDSGSSVRTRTPMVGYYGEAARSVVAWLFPEAGLEAIASSVLRSMNDTSIHLHYEGVADLLAALRVVELSGGTKAAAVHRAWNELDVERLARRHPVLCTLVLGVVWRLEPSVLGALQARLGTLGGRARALVRRRFADLPREGATTYRLPAVQGTRALQAVAPAGLQALRAEERRLLPLMMSGGSWVFAAILVVLPAVGSGAALNLSMVAVLALAWGATFVHRRRRVAPLALAGIEGPARLKELSFMGSRNGPRSWGVPPPQAFDRGELMLVVGFARAEAALRQGNVADAREQVAWWLSGIEQSSLNALDLHAIASSALRVATLLGYEEAAMRLHVRLTSGRGGRRRRSRHRTGHGDAVQAVGLACALHRWLGGKGSGAQAALKAAARGKAVVLDAFERELYGALLRQMSEQGRIIPDRLQSLLGPPTMPPWLAAIWPPATFRPSLPS